MREMKDSGIEWIGEIPEYWMLGKIGQFYIERNTKVSDKEYPPLSVTKNGVVPQLSTAAKTNDSDNRKLIKQYDFVINSRSDRRGSCGISQYDGSCSLINIVLKPQQNMCSHYYNYVFKSDLFADEFYKWGNGIVDDLWSTKWTQMKKIYVPYPPIPEQNSIANYLDSKCSQIDSIIEKTQQEIEKLKEYRQSIITEAVTKGLDPNVEMKDSGIEWIGMVPKKWGTPKICYLATVSSGGTPDRNNSRYWQGDIPWIKTGELLNEKISQTEEYITEEGLQNSSAKVYLPETILIAMYGQGKTRGMTGMLDIEAATNQACAAIQVNNPSMNNEFLWNVMIGAYDAIRSIAFGSGQPNLNAEIIKHFFVPMPPIEEQIEIVKYLSSKREAVDSTLEAKRKIISRLQQYKKSLIYECVTGKKEVPSNVRSV